MPASVLPDRPAGADESQGRPAVPLLGQLQLGPRSGGEGADSDPPVTGSNRAWLIGAVRPFLDIAAGPASAAPRHASRQA
jgi:hypothetical protein